MMKLMCYSGATHLFADQLKSVGDTEGARKPESERVNQVQWCVSVEVRNSYSEVT